MLKPALLTRRDVLLGTASVVVGNRVLGARPPQRAQNPTFSAEVEVVHAFVTVRDKKGAIVKDLAQEEFSLSEDGRKQAIRYFSRESDLPLTIGLLVDTTPSESNMLDVEKTASLAFLNRMLRPGKDAAFLIQYYYETELLQGLTSSREELEAAMDRLQPHGMGSRGGGPGPGSQGPGSQGGRGSAPAGGPGGGRGPRPPGAPNGFETALADAVSFASDEIMKSQPGRKALLILGDGAHLGERGERAIEAAQQADTLIYSIRIVDKDFGSKSRGWGIQIGMPGGGGRGGMGGGGMGAPGRGGPGGGADDHARGKQNLQELSRKTGGGYFEVGKDLTLGEIYGQIEEELRSQYSLGYTPDANARDGYRKIKIEVQRKGMVVRGREGYYPRAR